MKTRILFKGHEYPGVEAMPEAVRQAHDQALARFADADRNGVPDVMEGAAADSDNVVVIRQSSFTINGRTVDGVGDLPAPMRRLVEQAMASLGADAATPKDSPALQPTLTVSGDLTGFLDAFLRVLLALVAAAIIGGAVLLMLRLDASTRSQGGRLYIAGAAVVLLGVVESRFAWLERRRRGWFDAAASQRYGLRSLLFLLASTVVLVGLALLLP